MSNYCVMIPGFCWVLGVSGDLSVSSSVIVSLQEFDSIHLDLKLSLDKMFCHSNQVTSLVSTPTSRSTESTLWDFLTWINEDPLRHKCLLFTFKSQPLIFLQCGRPHLLITDFSLLCLIVQTSCISQIVWLRFLIFPPVLPALLLLFFLLHASVELMDFTFNSPVGL